MKTELRPVAGIKPYEKNPRRNDAAVEAVAESIRQFGFRQPIVVDGDGVNVVGQTWWKAARKLELKKVPVHVARDLKGERSIACATGLLTRIQRCGDGNVSSGVRFMSSVLAPAPFRRHVRDARLRPPAVTGASRS